MSRTLALPQGRGLRAAAAAALAFVLALSSAPAVEALGDLVDVIVIESDAGSAGQLTERYGGQVERELPIVGGVDARVPEHRLDDLSRIAYVVPDRAITMQSSAYGDGLVSAYPHEVGATTLWSQGATGAGVRVALVDTGVAAVPDLADRVIATANLTLEDTDEDTFGHGTFQAGLIAGNGASSDGRYVGVAPEAELVSIKVAGRDGSTSLGQVLAGVQLVDLAAEVFDVRVMLLAIDSESPLPPDLDPLSWALRTVWSRGVVVVVPAGNDGPDPGSISSPGEDPILLTAASVDDRGTPDVDDDLVSEFSGRGPTRWGDQKPDVSAPGEHLVSLRAPGSTVDEEYPSARVEDAYFKGSGTSMSAAVTVGAVALLLQQRPELDPDQVKALLMATATGIADGDMDSTGAGVVDAAAAASFDGDLPELPSAPGLGDDDPFPGLGRAVGQDRGDGHGWDARRWDARRWDARRWDARRWDARRWDARRWDIEEWNARQWAARQWAARQWTEEAWGARQWAARQWAARQWAARQWAARQWAARQWAARQWTDERWEARQWAARQWTARQWSARQWSARQWSARQWSARQWSARQWSARQWSSEQWEARQWSARQWSARQWNGRQWAGATWT